MIARRRHAVIAEHNQQRPPAVIDISGLDRATEPSDDLVHLYELRRHQRAGWSAEMPRVIDSEVVQEQDVPGAPAQELGQMSRHIVIDDDAAP